MLIGLPFSEEAIAAKRNASFLEEYRSDFLRVCQAKKDMPDYIDPASVDVYCDCVLSAILRDYKVEDLRAAQIAKPDAPEVDRFKKALTGFSNECVGNVKLKGQESS